jgi:hypothetical protein
MVPSKFLACLLLLAWVGSREAFACPWCRIENHLHSAIATADSIAIVEVGGKNGEKWRTVIRTVIKGKLIPGDTAEYGDRFRIGQPGRLMLAIGRTLSLEAVDNDLLPLDMLPEVRRLMQKDPYPTTADEAAEFLTSVSFALHDAGGTYYKAHPFEVQEALLRRNQALVERLASIPRPIYSIQQLQCGLMALMRIRSASSEEQMAREMDEFLSISKQPKNHETLYLAMARLETVFAALKEQPDGDLQKRIEKLLASAEGEQLSRISQCLIISELMTPEVILQKRPASEDAEWIRQAVVFSAVLRFRVWDLKTAAVLAQKAKAIPGKSAEANLAALAAALTNGDRFIPSADESAETPDDAAWYSHSSLFDAASWDKLPMARHGPDSIPLEIVILVSAAACLLFLILREVRRN